MPYWYYVSGIRIHDLSNSSDNWNWQILNMKIYKSTQYDNTNISINDIAVQ